MQAEALVPIAEAVKTKEKAFDDLHRLSLRAAFGNENKDVQRLLELSDILVDGPFIMEQRDLTLQYRGSKNQRVIDLVKTRQAGDIVLYKK